MSSLYRKYRPSSFEEVIGQSHVVTTLKNALAHKRVGHAYLFSGPRGTGKTTIARILAKELGTQPLDIIEIDAASNRGIDEARTLKEKVQVVPAQSSHKVFIIDEVHMLTKEAFNALLKTLEEPPAHAIFILATTEPEKIPETIISRTQRFDFRKISNDKIAQILLDVATKEEAALPQEAAMLIAKNADGAVRDALSILDQLVHSSEDKSISPEKVREVLGLPPLSQVQSLVECFITKNTEQGIEDIQRLSDTGTDFYLLLAHLIEYVRYLLLAVSYPQAMKPPMSESEELTYRTQMALVSQAECLQWLAFLFEARANMKVSPLPSLPLEIVLIRVAGAQRGVAEKITSSPETVPQKKQAPQAPEPSGKVTMEVEINTAPLRQESEIKESVNSAHNEAMDREGEVGDEEKQKTESQEASREMVNIEPISASSDFGMEEVFSRWSETLISVKRKNFVIGGFLRGGLPVEVQNDTLLIACKFPFHRDKILEHKNRVQIEDVLESLFGKKVRVHCVLESELTETQRTRLKQKEQEQEVNLTKNAMEMFEGKMVSE